MRLLLTLFGTFVLLTALSQTDEINKRQIAFTQDTIFIKDSVKTFKAIVRLNFRYSEVPYDFVVKYAQQINPLYSNTAEAKELNEKIDAGKLSLKGTTVKDFSILTDKNDTTLLSVLLKQHKLLLLDFWASSCLPCRQNSNFLKNIYTKYAAKGFTILGVSQDENRFDWLHAIMQDSLNKWYQGIDDDSLSISKQLGIYATPTFVLLNDKLQIVGKFNGRWKGHEDLEDEIVHQLQ